MSGGAFGDWFQFNAETYKRKNQFKVAGSPGSPGRVSIGNGERERWGAGGLQMKNTEEEEEREIIMGKPAMLQGNEGILNVQNILN